MSEPFSVLVFTKTAAFRHASIPAGIAMFRRLAAASTGGAHPFVVEASEDAEAVFTAAGLARFRVVVLLHNSGVFLDAAQLAALEAYVRGGRGGVVGIHAALGGLHAVPDVDPAGFYGRLLGAVFDAHPAAQLARVILKAPAHPIVAPLRAKVSSSSEASVPEPSYSHFDEWYNYEHGSCALAAQQRLLAAAAAAAAAAAGQQGGSAGQEGDGPLRILMTVDESTYAGGKHGDEHPIAWTQPDFEGSGTRVFYTTLGHFDDFFEDDDVAEHLHQAVLWAAKAI